MKKIIKGFFLMAVILCAFGFLAPTTALAGSASSSKIGIKIDANNPGLYYFIVPSKSNNPSCSSQYYFITNNKDIYSFILAAKLAGKTVNIFGSNTCSISTFPAEDISSVNY